MKTAVRFLLIAALVSVLVLAVSGAAFASPLKLVLPDNIPVKDSYTRAEVEEIYQNAYEEGYAQGQKDALTVEDGSAAATRQSAGGIDYVLNTNSKKFHYPDCRSVGQMKASNRKDFSGTRDEVIAMGYDPCGICHP